MMAELMVSSNNFSKGVSGKTRGLVNRDNLAISSKLVPGDGISVIAYSKAFIPCKAGTKARPQTGDIVIIQSEPYKQADEHVFVFLREIDDLTWETGESGQAFSKAPSGSVDGKLKQRKMRIRNNRLNAAAADGKPDRYVQGWLDLSQLDFVSSDWF